MRERPVLFNGDMVRAILDGSKTQTRRPVSPRDPSWQMTYLGDGRLWPHEYVKPVRTNMRPIPCPLGQVSDTLWVRECFAELEPSSFSYRADHDDWSEDCPRWWKWSPSIHMPRRASRLSLRVTRVRVERVQDITVDDACAEGVCDTDHYHNAEHLVAGGAPMSAERLAFANLWNEVYGTWDANPWVWATTFERVDLEGRTPPPSACEPSIEGARGLDSLTDAQSALEGHDS